MNKDTIKQALKSALFATPDEHLVSRDILMSNLFAALEAEQPASEATWTQEQIDWVHSKGKELAAKVKPAPSASAAVQPQAEAETYAEQLYQLRKEFDRKEAAKSPFQRAVDAAAPVVETVQPASKPEFKHPDDGAVDRFAVEMKAKLAKARAKGRGGWDNETLCTVEHLSELLREHVRKGDPVDVANFCMMLQQRGSGIVGSAGS